MAFVDFFIPGSDERQQMRVLKRAMGFFVMFCVSGVMSFNEIRYMIWGVTTRANAAVIHRSDSPKVQTVKIQYDFKDNKGDRHEAKTDINEADLDDMRASDGTIEIIYVSGSPSTCELTTERSPGWIMTFGVMCATLVAWIGIIYWNAVKDEKPAPKRRRTR